MHVYINWGIYLCLVIKTQQVLELAGWHCASAVHVDVHCGTAEPARHAGLSCQIEFSAAQKIKVYRSHPAAS